MVLVWPTSWTPALGSLFVCVSEWVCPRTFRHFGDDEPAKLEPEEGSLKSIYDEWLIMKLWCMCKEWPKDWCRGIFMPIYKKGNMKESSNYRTINLMVHASKVLLKKYKEYNIPLYMSLLTMLRHLIASTISYCGKTCKKWASQYM